MLEHIVKKAIGSKEEPKLIRRVGSSEIISAEGRQYIVLEKEGDFSPMSDALRNVRVVEHEGKKYLLKELKRPKIANEVEEQIEKGNYAKYYAKWSEDEVYVVNTSTGKVIVKRPDSWEMSGKKPKEVKTGLEVHAYYLANLDEEAAKYLPKFIYYDPKNNWMIIEAINGESVTNIWSALNYAANYASKKGIRSVDELIKAANRNWKLKIHLELLRFLKSVPLSENFAADAMNYVLKHAAKAIGTVTATLFFHKYALMDVKPNHIILTENGVKIIDLGAIATIDRFSDPQEYLHLLEITLFYNTWPKNPLSDSQIGKACTMIEGGFNSKFARLAGVEPTASEKAPETENIKELFDAGKYKKVILATPRTDEDYALQWIARLRLYKDRVFAPWQRSAYDFSF